MFNLIFFFSLFLLFFLFISSLSSLFMDISPYFISKLSFYSSLTKLTFWSSIFLVVILLSSLDPHPQIFYHLIHHAILFEPTIEVGQLLKTRSCHHLFSPSSKKHHDFLLYFFLFISSFTFSLLLFCYGLGNHLRFSPLTMIVLWYCDVMINSLGTWNLELASSSFTSSCRSLQQLNIKVPLIYANWIFDWYFLLRNLNFILRNGKILIWF